MKLVCAVLLLPILSLVAGEKPCNLRTTGFGSVCVCNSTYCDTFPSVKDLKSGEYQLFSTSKNRMGYSSTGGRFSAHAGGPSPAQVNSIVVSNLKDTHQTIVGFGGAFTDATGMNLRRLSVATRDHLLESYFGATGSGYSVGRVPIGGTDFSPRGYTYCDQKDESLRSFALQEEDYKFKIPFIHKAAELCGAKRMKLFASSWSAPRWMKTNGEYNGTGKLIPTYYKLWASYYLKFFDAYKRHNITFWGVTTQNEPFDGLIGAFIPNMGYNSMDMRRWIKEGLGPAIRNSDYKDLKIILHDDQRFLLPLLNMAVLTDEDVLKYADGIGVHFYSDFFTPPSVIEYQLSAGKNLFRMATEACPGYLNGYGVGSAVELGSWQRAEVYIHDILEDLQYDYVGWVDWNMALNETGGPTYSENTVDSPIIVSNTKDEFYKQPTYYAIGHFAKLIVPNSVRLTVQLSGSGSVDGVAFIRPDKKVVVILHNKSKEGQRVAICILEKQEVLVVPGNSITSVLYAV